MNVSLTNKLESEQFFLSLFVSTAKMPRHRKQQETVAVAAVAAVADVAAVSHQWKTSHRFWLVLRLIKARLSDQAISKSWWRQPQHTTTNKQRSGDRDTETVFFSSSYSTSDYLLGFSCSLYLTQFLFLSLFLTHTQRISQFLFLSLSPPRIVALLRNDYYQSLSSDHYDVRARDSHSCLAPTAKEKKEREKSFMKNERNLVPLKASFSTF